MYRLQRRPRKYDACHQFVVLELSLQEGRGGVLSNFLYGEAPPGGPTPYPFIYHF